MRIGLDLRGHTADATLAAATDADRLGLWAVLITAAAGAESALAAEIAHATTHVHLAVQFDAAKAHPLGIAEEVAILDHLSARRAIAVISSGTPAQLDNITRLLAGEIVDGTALTPPPAQTTVHTWAADAITTAALPGDLAAARDLVDHHRDTGGTHLFATWNGSIAVLARHLASRAAAPDFPDLVADYADTIAPLAPLAPISSCE